MLLRKFRFETDVRQPMALSQSNLRNIILLTVVECTKKRFLDLIDVLDIHSLFFFLDVDEFKQRVGASSLAILLHVAFEYFLNILFRKLLWIDLGWHRVNVCELSFKHLTEEHSWELDNDAVWKGVTIVDLHVLSVDFEWHTKIRQRQFQVDLIPKDHGWRFIVVLGLCHVNVFDQGACLLFSLAVRQSSYEHIQLFLACVSKFSVLYQVRTFCLNPLYICFLVVESLLSNVLEILLVPRIDIESMSHRRPLGLVDELLRRTVALFFISHNTIINVQIIDPECALLGQRFNIHVISDDITVSF